MDGELVLNAVEPLDHLEIEGRRAAPADRGGDHHDVRPVHQSLVHGGQLVGGIPLGDGAGPGAGMRRLGVVALAVAERELAQPDEPDVGAPAAEMGQRVLEQAVGGGEARVHGVHAGGGEAEHPRRRARGLGMRLEQMRGLVLEQMPGKDRRQLEVHPVGPGLEAARRRGASSHRRGRLWLLRVVRRGDPGEAARRRSLGAALHQVPGPSGARASRGRSRSTICP